jgi:hypothetical protein
LREPVILRIFVILSWKVEMFNKTIWVSVSNGLAALNRHGYVE